MISNDNNLYQNQLILLKNLGNIGTLERYSIICIALFLFNKMQKSVGNYRPFSNSPVLTLPEHYLIQENAGKTKTF